MVSKLHSGTSKTMQLPLFWESHCATCSPVYVILYHVTGWCKGPIFFVCWDGKGHQIKRQSIEHNAIVLRLTLKSKLTLVQKHFAVRAASIKIGYLAETMRIGNWTQKGSRITTSPLFISFFFFREKQEAIPDLGIVWACVRLIEQQNNTFVWDWRNIYITHRQCVICMYPRGRDSPDKYINIFNDLALVHPCCLVRRCPCDGSTIKPCFTAHLPATKSKSATR